MKQIEWALDVLECGAWWDNLSDDISDADLNPLDDAITTLRGTFDRLTYCSECKYFKQTSSTFGANHCMDTIVKTVRLDEVCCCPEKENEE
jgi:hypothetical protein|nr:MAG TPA: hypothetical protein [Bacteriophage sp.]